MTRENLPAGVGALPAAPLGNYPAARVGGGLIFVSGLSARQSDGTIAGAATVDGVPHLDVAVQTRTIVGKLQQVLGEYGATLEHCIDVTAFLIDMNDFAAFNDAYAQYFSIAAGPARTTLAVRALPRPGMAVELKVIAALPR